MLYQEVFKNRFPFPKAKEVNFRADQLRKASLNILRNYGEDVRSSYKDIYLKDVQQARGIKPNNISFEDNEENFIHTFVATNNGDTEPIEISIYNLGKKDVVIDIPSFGYLTVLTRSGIEVRKMQRKYELMELTEKETLERVNELDFILGLVIRSISEQKV